MGVNRWCVCLVGRVLCANLCRCRSRVLPYIHILNRQLQQLPVPVCRLRAGPHTCSPPLPCVSSPVTVCASAMNIRQLDRPMPQRKSTLFLHGTLCKLTMPQNVWYQFNFCFANEKASITKNDTLLKDGKGRKLRAGWHGGVKETSKETSSVRAPV